MFSLIDGFIAMVGQSLAGACHVTQVDVRSNNFDENIGQLFIPIIEKPHFESFSGIPVKKIRDNAITEIDVKGVEGRKLEACGGVILAHCLKSNSSVTMVEAFGNMIGPEGGHAFAKALETNTCIQELSLGSHSKPASISLKSLRENSVNTVDCSGKELLSEGGIVLAFMLRSNTSVTKVSGRF